MAHPRLLTTTHRKALTVGMTAALLAVPMAGVGAAATVPGTGVLDGEELLKDVQDEATGLLGAVDSALAVEEVTQPVSETVKTVEEITEPVTKVVEEVVKPAPAPVAPPADDSKDGVQDGVVAPAPRSGGVESAGGSPQPVSEPAPGTRNADRHDPGVRAAGGEQAPAPLSAQSAPPALRHEFTGGMRSSDGGLTLQPFQAPIVSNPFASQAPKVADDAITSTPVPSVAQAFEASISEVPRQLNEQGVPGGLTATAAGLLLLVGAGHLMHRSGHLRRVVTS